LTEGFHIASISRINFAGPWHVCSNWRVGAIANPPSQPSQTLTVGGNVSKRLVLDVAALRSREPSQMLAVPLADKDGNPASMVRGIRLRDLLEEAKLATRDQEEQS
jgi:hypothetical protein